MRKSDNLYVYISQWFLRVVSISLFFTLSGLANAQSQTITFCYESQDFPPYFFGSDTVPTTNPGILVEIVQRAAVKVGLTPVFIRKPWKRCIRDITKNTVDGTFAAIYLPQREDWGYFPKHQDGSANADKKLWTAKYPVFQLETTSPIWDGYSFNNPALEIGTPIGYVTAKIIDAMDVKLTTFYPPAKGLALLSAGKIDGYIVEEKIGKQLIQVQQLENINTAPTMFLKANWYLPLSHKFYESDPELAEEFWLAIAEERNAKINK